MNQKKICKHFLVGACRRKTMCEYSHEKAICQNHCPTPIGGSKCQDTACELRHPRLCLHFLQAECHFGKRCMLFHPVGILPALPYPLVTKLQQDMEKMRIQISNLKQEVNNLKHKSELILPTTGDDPSYEKFQPPDPPTDSISLPDINVHALRTNDYGEMETEVYVSYNCIVCSIRYSYDKLSPDILSIMQRHINTAAKRQSFLQKQIEEGKTRPKCATCQLFEDYPARVLIKALMVI